jgi:hypothetical protein
VEVYSGKSIGQELKSVTWTWKPLWVRKRNTSGDVGIYIYTYYIIWYSIYIYLIYHIISYIYIVYIYINIIYILCFYEFQWRATKTGTPKKLSPRTYAQARLTCSSPVFGLQAPAGTCRKALVTDSVRSGKWWFIVIKNGIL